MLYFKFPKKEISMSRMSEGQRAGTVSFSLNDLSYFETVGEDFVVKMKCGDKIVLDVSEEEFREKIK